MTRNGAWEDRVLLRARLEWNWASHELSSWHLSRRGVGRMRRRNSSPPPPPPPLSLSSLPFAIPSLSPPSSIWLSLPWLSCWANISSIDIYSWLVLYILKGPCLLLMVDAPTWISTPIHHASNVAPAPGNWTGSARIKLPRWRGSFLLRSLLCHNMKRKKNIFI